jgi:hypothetical protein
MPGWTPVSRLREALAGLVVLLDASAGEGRSAENATTQKERERVPIQSNRNTLLESAS